MPNFYHYTDDDGAQRIIRSGTIQASLRNMTNGEGRTAFGNGVYLTECSPFTHTKDEIQMNNWTRRTPETKRKLKNYFVISIPDIDIKNTKANGRNIFLFGYGNDLRLYKYPWMLVVFDSKRVIASYKYRVISSGPSAHCTGDYVMTDEIVNGRSVYMKTPDEYLYIGSHGAWFVGPCIGREDGYLKQSSANGLGPDSHVPWKYWDLTNSWCLDQTVAVKPFGKKIFLDFDLEKVEEKCPTFNGLNILQHVTATSEGKEGVVVKSILEISEGIECPSGITVLRNKNILIACGKDNSVKMFRPDGKFVFRIKSIRPFKNPTDLLTLSTGEFVVRDDEGLQLFNENLVFVKELGKSKTSKCCGLAEYENGNIITINLPKEEKAVVSNENISDGTLSTNICSLACGSINIGSYNVYKALLKDNTIIITEKGVQIKVPAIINDLEIVTINIPMCDILKVLAYFGKSSPVLFLYMSPGACKRARASLSMNSPKSFFIDITSGDESQKRLTILPEKMPDDTKNLLKRHFGSTLQEIEAGDANAILLRSYPKDHHVLKQKMVTANGSSIKKEDKEGHKSPDILFISPESGEVIHTINFKIPIQSKLRNISFHNKTLYITDFGLDCIYKLEKRKYVGKVGGTGTGLKQFKYPAGIVFDDLGNFIVADRWNPRMKIFDRMENFVGFVEIDVNMVCPPSGFSDLSIYLDTELKELYVLNYGGNSIVKYRITC